MAWAFRFNPARLAIAVANNQALEGTETQRVLLHDTTPALAGPLISTEDRQIAVYQQRMDAEFELYRQKLARQEAKEPAMARPSRQHPRAHGLHALWPSEQRAGVEGPDRSRRGVEVCCAKS